MQKPLLSIGDKIYHKGISYQIERTTKCYAYITYNGHERKFKRNYSNSDYNLVKDYGLDKVTGFKVFLCGETIDRDNHFVLVVNPAAFNRNELKEGDYIHSTFGAEFMVIETLTGILAKCTKGGYVELSEKYVNVGSVIIPDLICKSWRHGKHPETLEKEAIAPKVEVNLKLTKTVVKKVLEKAMSEVDSVVFELLNNIEKLKVEISELKAENAKLQHFKDSSIGLYCIDKNPTECSYDWIIENAFRLKDFNEVSENDIQWLRSINKK